MKSQLHEAIPPKHRIWRKDANIPLYSQVFVSLIFQYFRTVKILQDLIISTKPRSRCRCNNTMYCEYCFICIFDVWTVLLCAGVLSVPQLQLQGPCRNGAHFFYYLSGRSHSDSHYLHSNIRLRTLLGCSDD